MGYKVIINTGAYKNKRCSTKNWENGTLNNFMETLNGWRITEPNLKKLRWRIELFSHCGGDWLDTEYEVWLNQEKNIIKYYDKLCDFERTTRPEVYGFAQGYFDIDKVIQEVKENGSAKIPFKWCYDLRQYDKNMDGCYMEITKI